MLRIGLSGGIGSGKSTVAQRLAELGAVVIDADRLAREVVEPGAEGLAAIVERFGEAVVDDTGALNRAALGAVVFADPQARRDLELITHPRIAERTRQLVAAAPEHAVVVHDVPLLVEKHMGADYHLVVIVGASERTRLRRLTQRRGMTEDDVRGRIAAQATDEERRAAADVWLDNDASPQELRATVDALWEHRLVPFERNVRYGIPSRHPDDAGLCQPDPDWVTQAHRLAQRVTVAGGSAVVAVAHVGPTAVPGLAAPDVIDLQLGVTTLGDADTEAFLRGLHAAGFPRAEGGWWHRAHGAGPEPHERVHGNADPGRVARVRVLEVGGPAWREALLLRDWLRADTTARSEYAALDGRRAPAAASSEPPADPDRRFERRTVERMERWARQSGWELPRG